MKSNISLEFRPKMAEIGIYFEQSAELSPYAARVRPNCGPKHKSKDVCNSLVQMLDLNLAIRCVQEAFLSFSSLQFVATDVLTPPIVLLETTFRYRVWLFAKNLIIFS